MYIHIMTTINYSCVLFITDYTADILGAEGGGRSRGWRLTPTHNDIA